MMRGELSKKLYKKKISSRERHIKLQTKSAHWVLNEMSENRATERHLMKS